MLYRKFLWVSSHQQKSYPQGPFVSFIPKVRHFLFFFFFAFHILLSCSFHLFFNYICAFSRNYASCTSVRNNFIFLLTPPSSPPLPTSKVKTCHFSFINSSTLQDTCYSWKDIFYLVLQGSVFW